MASRTLRPLGAHGELSDGEREKLSDSLGAARSALRVGEGTGRHGEAWVEHMDVRDHQESALGQLQRFSDAVVVGYRDLLYPRTDVLRA